MAREVETQKCNCATHGTVEATREIPRMGFPFVYFAIARANGKTAAIPLP